MARRPESGGHPELRSTRRKKNPRFVNSQTPALTGAAFGTRARPGRPGESTDHRHRKEAACRQAAGQANRVPRGPRGRRAGRADRAVEGRRGRGRHARADLARERRDPGLQPPRQGRHVHGRPHGRRRRGRRLRRARAAGRRRQPGLPARRRGRRRVHARVLRAGQAGRRRSATGRGRSSRPTSCAGARSPRGRRCRPTSATPAATGSTRRSTSTRASSPRASPTTCRRSAPSSSRRSARASTRASAQSVGADVVHARGDPRHRRDARRHELPPRDRVVPGVPRSTAWCCRCGASTATSGWAATSWSPPSPARSSTPSTATTCAPPRRSCYMALIDEVEPLDGRARAARATCKRAGTPSCSRPRPSPTRSTTTSTCSTRASWPTAGPRRATSRSTKPEPDLVAAAVEKAGGGPAVMVGDSTWDCEAAKRAGVPTIAVLTGGFSERELREAGAACVFETSRAARAPRRHAAGLSLRVTSGV